MSRIRFCAAVLISISLGASGAVVFSQEEPVRKSVYGKLEKIGKAQNAIVMVTEDGEHLAWRFDPDVIERASEFEPGGEMIVIYRQTAPNEKIATALAFPGTAEVATYVNTTAERVLLRSAPAAEDGNCDAVDASNVSETAILAGAQAETTNGCWCCAPDGKSCTPGNKTGLGTAFLVSCFQ